jgi:diguanylate cyclase (GGDEF)-like protein/PAS domain S-box-containing protein
MEFLGKHLEKTIESCKISTEEIKEVINYLNLTKEDINLIKGVGEKIDEIPNYLIDEFYNHIIRFTEIRDILKNEKIDELKLKHKIYIKQVLSGNYDFDYIISRLVIGFVHAKKKLLPLHHIGAYGKYVEELIKFLKEKIPQEKEQEFFTALFKVILLDLIYSLESYFIKKQENITELMEKYRTILDASNDAILIINAKSLKIEDFNEKLKELVGLTEKQLIGLSAVKITPKILWKSYLKELKKIKEMESLFFPHILIENKKTKELIPCEINASIFKFNDNLYIVAIFRDIRKRKLLENEIERINRLYSVLSKINRSITKNNSLEDIFKETVKTIVEHGKFKVACISEINLKEKKIVPKYFYGDTNFIEKTEFPINDKTFIENISYLENDAVVIRDISQFPEESQWKKNIVKLGLKSAVAVPIYETKDRETTDIKWILSIYSDETRHFEEKEISLIKEIASDLFFVVKRLKEKQKFKYLSTYDETTGLQKRNLFIQGINSFIFSNKGKFAVIVLDIDKFKVINDAFGYYSGDLVLKKVSYKLQNLIKGKGKLARIGNDEFGIILFDIKGKEDILKFLKTVKEEFNSPITIYNKEIFITLSMGIAVFPDDGKQAEELILNSEVALSKAKSFEDYFYFYSQELNREAHETLELEKDIRNAVKNKSFEIFYQPKIDIKENKIIGAEALLRWKRKNREYISPVKFIPILENLGLINEVGIWVLEKVCNQILEWRKEGIEMYVSINISPAQLKTDKFLKEFIKVIEKTKCVSSFIELEITETVLMENIEIANQVFNKLEKYNIKFSIDDFGTGYSSLSYLKKLPVYALKIDREFIKDIPKDKDDLIITKTIVDLAENFNKETIAEGVETKEQVEILKDMGCRIVQGFYFSKPLPKDKFKKFYLEFPEQSINNKDKHAY